MVSLQSDRRFQNGPEKFKGKAVNLNLTFTSLIRGMRIFLQGSRAKAF